jgi:hypothetical protein
VAAKNDLRPVLVVFNEVAADETGASGDKNSHIIFSPDQRLAGYSPTAINRAMDSITSNLSSR